jgi:hypothetical protein
MGKGAWQWQTGLQWTGSNSSSFQDQNFLSEHVLRFGAFEDFDVALLLNLDRNQRTFNDESTSETGLSLWGVRLRDHLYSGDGIISGLAWQFDILLPNVREYSRDTYASAQWTAMVDFKLSDQLGLSTNAGLRWVEASRAPLGLYVANLNYSFGRHTVFIGITVSRYQMAVGHYNMTEEWAIG